MHEQPTYTEMGFDDSFNFTCGAHVSCFVDCCAYKKVWLYPYDVLRMRQNLNITSGELLKHCTSVLYPTQLGYPVLLLKSANEGAGRCVFAEDSGCTIYPDRPWVCRLFPVIPVECRTDTTPAAERRFSIYVWEGCRGVGCGPKVSIREWWQRTGMNVYEETCLDWQQLLDELKNSGLLPLTGEAAEQFRLGSYDPDLFRMKLLAGEFRDTLPLDEAELEQAARDDIYLLKVSCRWLRWELLQQPIAE